MRFASLATATALIAATFTGAQATPVQFAGNGHWYEFIPAGTNQQGNPTFTWFEALADALTKTCNTCGPSPQNGYLVTITSAAENAFASALAATSENAPLLYWAAGSDSDSEGNWIWKAGPENFQAFTYANWAPGEPSDSDGGNPFENGEDYLAVNWNNVFGGWNDFDSGQNVGDPAHPFHVSGYVVEFDGQAPEPATLTLIAFGLGALGLSRGRIARRRQG